MLKSSNLESIISAADTPTSAAVHSRPDSLQLNAVSTIQPPSTAATPTQDMAQSADFTSSTHNEQPLTPTLASKQLATGLLQIFEPPLVKSRLQLKELIGKQNKIYIDLSAEKYKLDNAEMANLHEMMNNVKVYRDKLIKIKKQMQSIYQRTKVLKKRAANIQACKQKELQRKLQKQQQEESLIGKQ